MAVEHPPLPTLIDVQIKMGKLGPFNNSAVRSSVRGQPGEGPCVRRIIGYLRFVVLQRKNYPARVPDPLTVDLVVQSTQTQNHAASS